MMAMLFMLSERIRHKDTDPLLSCADIEELPVHFLPRRDLTEEAVFQIGTTSRAAATGCGVSRPAPGRSVGTGPAGATTKVTKSNQVSI
jgi:hypothetical protein